MPEFRAKSGKQKDVNKAVSANIDAMAHGAHHGQRVKQQGAKKAHEMEVAAAERIAHGGSRGKKRSRKRS